MNKGDLISKVAEVLNSKKEAQAAVECVLSNIVAALEKRETVQLIGFGTFKVNKRNAREGRNPQTGESMKIAEKWVPKFVPGKAMKDAVGK